MAIPDPETIEAMRARLSNDPNHCAVSSEYFRLLAVLDELLDQGQNLKDLTALTAEIEIARRRIQGSERPD